MVRGIIGWATVAAVGLAASVSAQPRAEGTPVLPISLAEGTFGGFPQSGHRRFPGQDPATAEVGDVNGDGLADVAIGVASADPLRRRDAGVVHVVFGGSPLGRIDIRSSALAGFRIIGPHQGRRRPPPVFQPDSPPRGAMAGTAVAGAGDVNGDGLGDVLVGAPYVGNRRRSFSGSVYVVFGKRSGEPVDLARLDGGGYRIDGPNRGSAAGYTLAGPGDVSGDGRPDVVLSTWDAVYVVHGRAGAAPVDLRRLAGRGFTIRGRRPFFGAGAAVSGAGDFSGDGVADIAVGAPFSTVRRRPSAGATFVVFGGPDDRPVSLARLNGRGVRIDGEHEFSHFGGALAPMGDVNGDGRGELLIGASLVSAPGRRYPGAAYVVFGRPDPGVLELRQPGGGGYRILGPRRLGASGGRGDGRAGVSVAAIGDVNGDGRPDMAIGAPGAGRRCSPEEGAAYVVFGQSTPSPLDLDHLGEAGYAIRGGQPDVNAGALVAGAGDWNRDGRGDALVLRADFDDSQGRQRPLLDLVFGRVAPAMPPAPSPEQLPSIEIPRPRLDRLLSGRGITARLTLKETGSADAVLVELYSPALGSELPVALGYARFSRPGTRAVTLRMPRFVRPLARRHSRLRARVLLSQCTTAGYEYTAQSRIVLRRR
jgi:FG-GAP repeat protein